MTRIDFKTLKRRKSGVRVSIDEVIERGVFVIHSVEQRIYEGEVYLAFHNNKDEYIGSFAVILDFFANIIDEHGMQAVNESLAAEPMAIKIRREKSKKTGRTYSDFDIIESQAYLEV